ncbi:hypothetical protein CYMTET_2823 [Cymbomonas tetramitiformis]|uniref:Uncharacterized protein n=1 Tax=Cymbomonas tetramitiformis TaxID=36881 RepID=A0AAE0LLF7_9CHLO|nr:hypothetical protein CYMTET_2823 [Cymbomonas tetramitiformis]
MAAGNCRRVGADFKRILRRGCYNLTTAEIGGKVEDQEYEVEQATGGKKIKVEKKMPAPTEDDSDDTQIVQNEVQRRKQTMVDLGVPLHLLGGKGGTASGIPAPKAVQTAPDPPENPAAPAKAKNKPTAAKDKPAAAKAKPAAAKAKPTAAKANTFPEPPKRKYRTEDLSQYAPFFSTPEMKTVTDKLVNESINEKILVLRGDLVGSVCQEAFGTGTVKRWYIRAF